MIRKADGYTLAIATQSAAKMTKQANFTRSQTLHERALRSIPTASQTFSKTARMFVGGAAPIFAERAQGCRLWDVDGNSYIDYILGLLPVVLGYCDADVDAAIRDQLGRGITFSLATELEAELAERLVRLVPCAEMVRFGKNGTDATSAAVRLARAHTGRDRVAVCGYHGWQDWYIGTTARHLGVPEAVRSLSATFRYNDADSLLREMAETGMGAKATSSIGMPGTVPRRVSKTCTWRRGPPSSGSANGFISLGMRRCCTAPLAAEPGTGPQAAALSAAFSDTPSATATTPSLAPLTACGCAFSLPTSTLPGDTTCLAPFTGPCSGCWHSCSG